MINIIASIAGILGATLLFGQLLLGNRHLNSLVTQNIFRVNKLHRWLGKGGVLLVLVHPVMMTIAYAESWLFIIIPRDDSPFSFYVSLGRISLLLLIVIAVTSIGFRHRIPHRLWHFIHYLAYPLMGLVLLHANAIGSLISTIPVITWYWNGLMIAYLGVLFHRISMWAGIGKKIYVLKSKKQLSLNVYEFRFMPLKDSLNPKPGQFVYLQTKRFGAAHPFTVLNFDRKSGELAFAVKVSGPFSASLAQLPLTARVFIDGPYGVFTQEGSEAKSKVFIAGGIGITPFVQPLLTDESRQTYLFYSNRDVNQAVYREKLKQKLGERFIDIVSSQKRLDVELIKENIPASVWHQANYYICGPEGLHQSLTQALVNQGIPQRRIFTEKFSF